MWPPDVAALRCIKLNTKEKGPLHNARIVVTVMHCCAGARRKPAKHIQICGIEECSSSERQAPVVVWVRPEAVLRMAPLQQRCSHAVAEASLRGLLTGSMYL